MTLTIRKKGDPSPDWSPLKKGPLIIFGQKPPPGWLEKQRLKKLKAQAKETPPVQSIVDEIVRLERLIAEIEKKEADDAKLT